MRIAVVSGINKLSIEICKILGQKNVKPILVSLNRTVGQEMEDSIKLLGNKVEYRKANGFSNFIGGMQTDYEKLEILINTADVFSMNESKEDCHKVVRGNFYDTLHLTRSLLPLMKKSDRPRIVNVLGTINLPCCRSTGTTPTSPYTPTIMGAFVSEAKNLPQLEFLVRDYLNDVDLGDYKAKGWPDSSYGMSRLALISLTRILSREESPVLINACNSDRLLDEGVSERGALTLAESAMNPVILATELPNGGPTGNLYADDLPITW